MWTLAVVLALATLSPLLTDAIGLPRSAWWAAGTVVLLAAALTSPSVRRQALSRTALVLLVFGIGVALVTLGTPRAALIPVVPLLPLLLLARCSTAELTQFTHRASRVLTVMLVGAWLGLGYYLAGGPPLFSFAQYDGRTSEWYLTTLSVTADQGFMRASSVFDEPGALSLVVCMVAGLRLVLGMSHGPTMWLLMLATVTGSVAHMAGLLLLGLHMALASGWWRRIRPLHLGLGLLLLVPLVLASYQLLLAPRLVETESGRIEADTRTPLILRSVLLLEDASWSTGLDGGLCYFDPVTCVDTYGIFVESPLGPMLALGLANSLPYYLFLLYLLVLSILRPRMALVHLTMLALFLQRPYVMNVGYATLVALYVVATLAGHRLSAARSPVRPQPHIPR